MKEREREKRRPKPNWLGRAAIGLTTLGAIGIVGTIVEAVIDNNAISKKVDRTLPQIPSFEEFVRAEGIIATVEQYDRISYNRLQERSQLQFELRESGEKRSPIVMISSIFLLTTATVLLQQQHSKRPDGNQQKNTQQTNPTA